MYETCERIAAFEVQAIVAAFGAIPDVPVAPSDDGPIVRRSTKPLACPRPIA